MGKLPFFDGVKERPKPMKNGRALVRILKIPVQNFFLMIYTFSNSTKIFFLLYYYQKNSGAAALVAPVLTRALKNGEKVD